jgi:hypothetical protein
MKFQVNTYNFSLNVTPLNTNTRIGMIAKRVKLKILNVIFSQVKKFFRFFEFLRIHKISLKPSVPGNSEMEMDMFKPVSFIKYIFIFSKINVSLSKANVSALFLFYLVFNITCTSLLKRQFKINNKQANPSMQTVNGSSKIMLLPPNHLSL